MAITTNVNISSLLRGVINDNSFMPISVPTGVTPASDIFTSKKYSVGTITAYIGAYFKLESLREGVDACYTQANNLASYVYSGVKNLPTYINNIYTYVTNCGSVHSTAKTYFNNGYSTTYNAVSNIVNNLKFTPSSTTTSYTLTPSPNGSKIILNQISASTPTTPGLITNNQLATILADMTSSGGSSELGALTPATDTTYGAVTWDWVDSLIKGVKHDFYFNFIGDKVVYSHGNNAYVNDTGITLPYAGLTTYGLINLSDFTNICKSKELAPKYEVLGYIDEPRVTTNYIYKNHDIAEVNSSGLYEYDHDYEGLVKLTYARDIIKNVLHKPNISFSGNTSGISVTSGFDGSNSTTSWTAPSSNIQATMSNYGFTTNAYLSNFINTYAKTYVDGGNVTWGGGTDSGTSGNTKLVTLAEVQKIVRQTPHTVSTLAFSDSSNCGTCAWLDNNQPPGIDDTYALFPRATDTAYGVVTYNLWRSLMNSVDFSGSDKRETALKVDFDNTALTISMRYSDTTGNTYLPIGAAVLPLIEKNNPTAYGFVTINVIHEVIKDLLTNM